MMGRRWDVPVNELLDFERTNWQEKLSLHALKCGQLHGPTGIDYLVFRRGTFGEIPPFAVGRPGWDNYIVYRARSMRIPVIDVTKAVMAVHQNHDYGHHPGGEAGVLKGVEAKRNWRMAGNGAYILDVRDATHVVGSNGLRVMPWHKHLCRRLLTLLIVRHNIGFPLKLVRNLRRRLR